MTHRTATPAPGDLLIAPPEARDPNFRRTVVLVCDHTDEGTFGLVLNRPLEAAVRDLPLGLGSDDQLWGGGPVQENTLHWLHMHGGLIPEAMPVSGRVHWGGDFSAVRLLLKQGEATPGDLRLYLGYAGWSGGQLEDEIRDGVWFITRGEEELIFAAEPGNLWRTVLIRMGGDYALLVNYPDNPRFN